MCSVRRGVVDFVVYAMEKVLARLGCLARVIIIPCQLLSLKYYGASVAGVVLRSDWAL